MHKQTIGLCYLTRNDDVDFLRTSIFYNHACFAERIQWLLVLNTGPSSPSRLDPLLRILDRRVLCVNDYRFGSGFQTAPNVGGFNEVAARNYLFQLASTQARLHPVDWVVWCDSDEYFARVPTVDRSAELLLFTTGHLMSKTSRLAPRELIVPGAKYGGSEPRVFIDVENPHPRAVRPAALDRLSWRRNWRLPPGPNQTRHCVLGVTPGNRLLSRALVDRSHMHFGSLAPDPAERELYATKPWVPYDALGLDIHSPCRIMAESEGWL